MSDSVAHNYVFMTYVAMAYIGMTYVAMACTVMAYVVMAYIVMAHIVMAYVVMAYVVMTYAVVGLIRCVHATHMRQTPKLYSCPQELWLTTRDRGSFETRSCVR